MLRTMRESSESQHCRHTVQEHLSAYYIRMSVCILYTNTFLHTIKEQLPPHYRLTHLCILCKNTFLLTNREQLLEYHLRPPLLAYHLRSPGYIPLRYSCPHVI
ncbi:hypothetical protein GQ42DRAFT_82482 [Ramicandelaber brevisporus]|nr:hypothetical protein GQ42DRAFT_82482 [Ramicandelaber brevisporus]